MDFEENVIYAPCVYAYQHIYEGHHLPSTFRVYVDLVFVKRVIPQNLLVLQCPENVSKQSSDSHVAMAIM